jgi:hypothetical protein
VKSVLVQQVWLGLSLAVAWLVVALPVAMWNGDAALGWLAVAAVLCFLPGCVVLTLQPLWKSAGAAGLGVMLGMVLRMISVVAGMLAVAFTRPEVSLLMFGCGLSVFYLVALGVETLLVVRDLDRAAVRRV